MGEARRRAGGWREGTRAGRVAGVRAGKMRKRGLADCGEGAGRVVMRPGGKVGGRREDGGRARGGRSEGGGRAPGGRGAGGERTVVRRREGPVVLRVVGRGALLFVQKVLASIFFPVLLMNVLPTLLTPGKPEGCGPRGLRYSGRDGPGEHRFLRPLADVHRNCT